MHNLFKVALLIFLVNNLIAQPLRFFDKVDSAKYTALEVVADDKGGWLTLASAEDSSFSMILFDYCGKVISQERFKLPPNSKLHTPQMTFVGNERFVIVATLTTDSSSKILIFSYIQGIISQARLFSTESYSHHYNPVLSALDRDNILIAFNYDADSLKKSRILLLDANYSIKMRKDVGAESQIRWIRMLNNTEFFVGDGFQVRKYNTLGTNLWSRNLPEQQMVYNSMLLRDTQVVFLTDYINRIPDTTQKTKFKQLVCLDIFGNFLWTSERIRSMQTNYMLEYSSKLLFDRRLNYIFNGIDTIPGDTIPSIFAHVFDENGLLKSSSGWSAKDSVIDYKSTLLNDGNFGVCIALGNADSLKGFANIKSSQTYEGTCDSTKFSNHIQRSVNIQVLGQRDLSDSVIVTEFLTLPGISDSFKLNRVCEFFDLKDQKIPFPLCRGDSVFLPGIMIPNATYVWDNGSTAQGIYVKVAGDYNLVITYCEKTITITYQVFYITYSDRDTTVLTCEYPYRLNASNQPTHPAKFLWASGDTTSFLQIAGPGTYVVSITECEMTYKVSYRVSLPTFQNQVFDFKICDYPDTLYAFQGPLIKNVTYTWQDGTTQPFLSINGTGTYKVTINYCQSSFEQTFRISLQDDLQVQDATLKVPCDSFPQTLTAISGNINLRDYSFKWSSGETTNSIIINKVGTYIVTINYCMKSYERKFHVEEKEYHGYPNVFVPNSEIMENKIFIPTLIDTATTIVEYQLTIYNRWGHQVFESNNPIMGWDGNYKGEPAPMETYMFVVMARSECGIQKGKKGTVTLIR